MTGASRGTRDTTNEADTIRIAEPSLDGSAQPAPKTSDDEVRGLTLRRKLLTVFGGLAMLALLVVGMSWWVIGQWRATNAELEGHYLRSLLLQRIRAASFRAFKEVPDAVTGGDADARQEFEALLAPASPTSSSGRGWPARTRSASRFGRSARRSTRLSATRARSSS